MVFSFFSTASVPHPGGQVGRLEQDVARLIVRIQVLEEENQRLSQANLAGKAEIQALREEAGALKVENQELKARLAQNSQNSSKPPSQDPPGTRPSSEKPPTGRKRGAQPGHPGYNRVLLPLEQVDVIVARDPQGCSTCGLDLGKVARTDLERWQVTEIPEIKPHVTEYQMWEKICPCCRTHNWGTLPGTGPRSAFGPNLQAITCLLSGSYHLSFSQVHNLLTDVFHIPISVGSIQACRRAGIQACAPACQALKAEVKAAAVVHADETGFENCQGQRMWLWVAVTPTAEVFLVLPGRGYAQAEELLGSEYAGVIERDRWKPYEDFAKADHQLCWSHLRRNLQGLLEVIGETGVQVAMLKLASDRAFACWGRFKVGQITRIQLLEFMAPIRKEFRVRLECVLADKGATKQGRRLAKDLLRQEDCLWTYLSRDGVEPTNNSAERSLRQAVIWRHISYGANVPDGCQFVGTILTIIGSAKRKGVNARAWLARAIGAFRDGKSPPILQPI